MINNITLLLLQLFMEDVRGARQEVCGGRDPIMGHYLQWPVLKVLTGELQDCVTAPFLAGGLQMSSTVLLTHSFS